MITQQRTVSILGACVLAMAVVQTASGQGFFPASRIHIPDGGGLSLGDLDRDGKVDLVAGSGGNSYLFCRGDGLGGFAPPVTEPLSNPFFASGLARVLDLDSDGRPDILVLGPNGQIVADDIHVRLGLAGGGLGADVASTLPQSLLGTSGDESFARFDTDAYVDYAYIRSNGQEILLARGSASGAFGAPTTIHTTGSGSSPWDLAAGDIDADSDTDLLFLDLATQTVSRLTNDGNGTFAPAVTVTNTLGTSSVDLIDVDEDARPDIVFALESPPYGVWFAKGLGAGTFAAPAQLFPTSDPCGAFLTCDIDVDGHTDLAACNSVARGLGGGAYAAPVSYPSADIVPIGVIDIDGDGRLDLALAGDSSVTLLLGRGGGTLVSPEFYDNGVRGTHLVDFNGDGLLDVVGNSDAPGVATSIGVQYGLPGGTFGAMQTFPVGSTYNEIAVGDLNLDGRPDVVATCGTVRVMLGTAGGGLASAVEFPAVFGSINPTIGDVSGDGLPDVVVAEGGYYNGHFFVYGDEIGVLRGDGAGGLLAPERYTLDIAVTYPTIADFDNDGRNDVVTSTKWQLLVQLGTPAGTLSAPINASGLGGFARPSCVDFDGDGNLDYIATIWDSGTYVLLGDGLGSFPSQHVLQTFSPPDLVATADFDGNGRVDIVCGVEGGFELFLQESSGAIAAPRAYSNTSPTYTPSDLAAADIDGDGRVDVLSAVPSLMVNRNLGPPSRIGVYCTAKVNSNGCAPTLWFTGSPSATQSNGFVVSASSLVNQKSGMFFYGLNGSIVAPFAAGQRCVANPLRRTLASLSGGTSLPLSDCSGVISIDMNAFARGALGGAPDPALSIAGTHVHCQAWARDVGAPPNNMQLSAGLQYFVGP